MQSAAAIEKAGLLFGPGGPEGVLSFLASRSKSHAREMVPSATEVLKGCSEIIDQFLRSVIDARNKAEFGQIFESAFPKYVQLTLAVSQVTNAVVPKPVLERLARESISEMEADFRDKGLAVFGAAVRDQALFTVWTLRKIKEVVTQIAATRLVDAKKKDDAEYCAQFNVNTLRAQFSLDCLNMALHCGQAIYPEVQDELVDGLRAMVNAYAWARRGLEIRLPSEDFRFTAPELDDEDRELMEASFSEASAILDIKGA